MSTMFKKIRFMLLALAVLFAFTAPQAFAYNHFVINVYKDTGFATAAGGYTAITSGVQYFVLDYDADPIEGETIYSDTAATAMTNPVTSTVFEVSDKIDFYTADADDTVDILIVDNDGGFSLFLDNVTTSTRTAIINERPNEAHVGTIWWTTVCSGETVTDNGTMATGVTLRDSTIIDDMIVEIIRASGSAITVSWSASSTLDTFLAAGSLTGEVVVDASGNQFGGHDLALSLSSASLFYGTYFWPVAGTTTLSDCFGIDYASSCVYFQRFPAGPGALIRGDQCLGYKVNSSNDETPTTQVWYGSAGTAQGWGLFHYFFKTLK